jgi:hypothetical protein
VSSIIESVAPASVASPIVLPHAGAPLFHGRPAPLLNARLATSAAGGLIPEWNAPLQAATDDVRGLRSATGLRPQKAALDDRHGIAIGHHGRAQYQGAPYSRRGDPLANNSLTTMTYIDYNVDMDDKNVRDYGSRYTARGAARAETSSMTVASEVWLVVALLHREHPESVDFSTREIIERAKQEQICGSLRAGFSVHVTQHCVANRAPNPARLRMLIETARGRRRLFRTGDQYDPRRDGGRTLPDQAELPARYRGLLEWYAREYGAASPAAEPGADPLLSLRGRGKEIWGDEHPDDYVRSLREGWP